MAYYMFRVRSFCARPKLEDTAHPDYSLSRHYHASLPFARLTMSVHAYKISGIFLKEINSKYGCSKTFAAFSDEGRKGPPCTLMGVIGFSKL